MVLPRDFSDARVAPRALADRTTLGLGGPPEHLFEPRTESEVVGVVRACLAGGVRLRVLGGGSNLLVGDAPLRGAVLDTRGLAQWQVGPDRVDVGAGYSFPRLVKQSIELGLPGLPGCPGIPGRVGGAVFMNAGGRFGCVADALCAVRGVDAQGVLFERYVTSADFGYRHSPFGGCVITGAAFRRDRACDVEAARRLHAEATAWKRGTQPLSVRSAGCIFRNPPGHSAGALIEQAGLKGARHGNAEVSSVHANFIVNRGGATAGEVVALIEQVKAVVRERFGISLQTEVEFWS